MVVAESVRHDDRPRDGNESQRFGRRDRTRTPPCERERGEGQDDYGERESGYVHHALERPQRERLGQHLATVPTKFASPLLYPTGLDGDGCKQERRSQD